MDVLFAGTDSVLPAMGNDTACCVIDRSLMLDFGWHGACQLEAYGVEPWNLQGGFLTHIHQDHFIGLIPFLFYNYMNQKQRTVREPLQIGGPASGISEMVDRVVACMKMGGSDLPFPKLDVKPLQPGQTFTVGKLTIQTGPSSHNVDSISYRISCLQQGQTVSMVYSGDTGYCEQLVEFASGADLLVHESSRALEEDVVGSAHSTVEQACRVARQAQVKSLALVHMTDNLRESVGQRAQDLMGRECFTPLCGDRLIVTPNGAEKLPL